MGMRARDSRQSSASRVFICTGESIQCILKGLSKYYGGYGTRLGESAEVAAVVRERAEKNVTGLKAEVRNIAGPSREEPTPKPI